MRADVEDQVVILNFLNQAQHRSLSGRRPLPHHPVHRLGDFRRLGDSLRRAHQFRLMQGGANRQAASGGEGVGDAAADNDSVHQHRQFLQHGKFAGHLGTADDGHQGTGRGLQGAGKRIKFPRQQRAGASNGRVQGHPTHGGMGTVGGGEGVHYEDLRQRRQALGQRLVPGLFALEEPSVFQQGDAGG